MADNSLFDFPGLNIKWGQSLSGDLSGKLPKTTVVAKVNGVSFPANPTIGTVPYVTSANTVTWTSPSTFDPGPINRNPSISTTINTNYSLYVLRKFIVQTNLKLSIKADGVMRIS